MLRTTRRNFVAATFILAVVSLAGCSGEFWSGYEEQSVGGELGATYGGLFGISPEEGILSADPADAREHARDMREVGARMIRLQFCNYVADTGQIDPGALQRLRRMVDVAHDAGLQVYAQLNYCTVVPRGYDPASWKVALDSTGQATVALQEAWHDGFDDSIDGNEYARDFEDATRAFADEFGDSVDYWEVWNEPNGAPEGPWDDTCTSMRYGVGPGHNWSVCPRQLGVLTSKVARALAAEDPGGRIVAGNVLFHGDNYSVAKEYWSEVYRSDAVEEFVQSRGRYPWHVVGIHPYGVTAYVGEDDENPENGLREQVDDFRRFMADDDPAPLAVTEHGWTTDPESLEKRVIATDMELAMQVRDFYPLAHALGIEFVMWFNMRDSFDGGHQFGIQRSDGGFKAAGLAYCEVARVTDCPAGVVQGPPGPSGRVAARVDGITDPPIEVCHARNGGTGKPLDNGGGPHVHRWGSGWVQDLRDPVLGDTICMRADTETKAWMVRGAIRDAYFEAGGAPGKLGYPTSDELSTESGPFQTFEHGWVTWSHADGRFVAYGPSGVPL